VIFKGVFFFIRTRRKEKDESYGYWMDE